MGLIRHSAIVVTSGFRDRLERVHRKATELGMAVSGIVDSPINGYYSFFVAPDGSKEGWPDSDEGDRRRAEFAAALEGTRACDGGAYIDWIEVMYGTDDGWNRVVRGSDGETLDRLSLTVSGSRNGQA